jgi:hypothetical protein
LVIGMLLPAIGGALCKRNEMRPVPAGSGRARVYLCFRWPRKSNENPYTLLFRSLRDAALTAISRPGRDVRRDGAVGRLKVRSRLIDASRPRHAAVARLWRRRPVCSRYRETGATRRRRICFCKAIYRLATSIRAVISWAELLQRVFLEDALACPCGGGRRVIA